MHEGSLIKRIIDLKHAKGESENSSKHASGLSQWPTNISHGHLHNMAKAKLPVHDHTVIRRVF